MVIAVIARPSHSQREFASNAILSGVMVSHHPQSVTNSPSAAMRHSSMLARCRGAATLGFAQLQLVARLDVALRRVEQVDAKDRVVVPRRTR